MNMWIKVLVYNKYQLLLQLIIKVLSVVRVCYFSDFSLSEINILYIQLDSIYANSFQITSYMLES